MIKTQYTSNGTTGPTIGAQFYWNNIDCPKATVMIWDTSGDKRYIHMTALYVRGSCIGVIVVFDVTNEESFANVEKTWLPLIKRNSGQIIILVGTKCDLDTSRVVSKERALLFADEQQIRYFEASGKTGYNVEYILTELTRDVIEMIENDAKK